MKQPREKCTYKDSQTHAHCTSRSWKAGESLCIKHDIQETIQTAALDRVLKHHPKHCNYWVFSSDRHCSCGRDEAIKELDRMRGMLRAVTIMYEPKPYKSKDTATD